MVIKHASSLQVLFHHVLNVDLLHFLRLVLCLATHIKCLSIALDTGPSIQLQPLFSRN